MSLLSFVNTGRLPEKPWRIEAVVRLLASIVICVMIGAVIAGVIRYCDESARKSPILFIGGTAGAFALFGIALAILAKRWPAEKYLRNLLILLLSIYGGFVLMWLMAKITGDTGELQNSTVRILLAVLTFQGAALVLVHFFLRGHQTNWAAGFGFNNRLGFSLLLGFGVGIVTLPAVWLLQALSAELLERLTFHPHEQEAVELLRATEGWSSRFLLAIATILLAPVAEEVLFRGILYPAIKRAGFPQLALWGTAVLFGLIHFNLGTFIPLTFLAVVLVCLYEYTGNLLACIMVHSFFNAANFVALYLFQK